MEELTGILVPLSSFALIFGIVYLRFMTRNKERMALIEKGADASIFASKEKKASNLWKMFILNTALLLMGIGIGIFIATIIVSTTNVKEEAIYPGTILLMAGAGLFVGYLMSKKL